MDQNDMQSTDASIRRFNTVIVGAGAAGMNCAVHLYELMRAKGVEHPEDRIAVVTRGVPLGTSRMSGSDKQTYYKLGTAAEIADSAAEFAKSLTAGGCAHEDLAVAEGVGSLREFYHLIRAGVPFPCDSLGSFVGYKTDHDPQQRATSAGPRTSRMMSQCLQREVESYGIPIFDHQEVATLIMAGPGVPRRIVGVACVDASSLRRGFIKLNVFECENLVLAAGGPGGLYETSVYPKGQVGLHGLAFEAGLAAENLTESQFGMASTKFRWNVSGTYMQAIPRIFSTDADGDDPREFLADAFPSMAKLATSIFLKGYQWPFDPQRITDHQSSLIDLLVSQETQRGRRVFLDFRENPIGGDTLGQFDLESLKEEAIAYLRANEALQATPIERLAHMNPLAIDIYAEHGIDLRAEPLEIAVCAQHCNGGFAVNHWWESSLPHTFVIGEMAGTHGVKRPGGSALNAGQVGGLRAAEYIVNVHGVEVPSGRDHARAIEEAVTALSWKWSRWMTDHAASGPADVQGEVRARMTAAAAHFRRLETAEAALDDAMGLVEKVRLSGLCVDELPRLIEAIQAEHLALTSVAFLKAIVTYLREGGGSRGSFLVTTDDGQAVHPMLRDSTERTPLCCLPENVELRESIFQVVADDAEPYGFKCEAVPVRKLTTDAKAFEAAWRDYRDGRIYEQ